MEPADAVAANDARARVWRSSPELGTLLVGLAPGWELGFLHRALAGSVPGPIDAYWGTSEGILRSVDGGASVQWSAIDPARYRALWLIGDPNLLGAGGRRWVERFTATGGRGIFWGPGGSAGELVGLRAPGAGGAPAAPPALTEAGRRWLEGVVGPLASAPDGSADWPPLEGLPSTRPAIPTQATVLVEAGGAPAAWSLERGRNRLMVALGTGWYRLELEGGPRAAAGRSFWRAWTEAAARWLSAASAEEAALVTMPESGRVRPGMPLELRRTDPAGEMAWRVLPVAGGSEAASGVTPDGAGSIAIGPLPSGAWTLELDAGGRRETRALAVEIWSPDVARTEADTTGLARMARASGGALVDGTDPLPRPESPGVSRPGRVTGLSLAPWAFLLAAGLLLACWAAAARAR